MNNEFWMPMPAGGPHEPYAHGFERLTADELAVYRRLLGRERAPRYARRTTARRERAALRRRREVLSRLGIGDIRRLVQIIDELGL